MLEHLVLYPSVVIVAVLGLSHSALRSVAAVTLAGHLELSPQLRCLRRRQREEIVAGRK